MITTMVTRVVATTTTIAITNSTTTASQLMTPTYDLTHAHQLLINPAPPNPLLISKEGGRKIVGGDARVFPYEDIDIESRVSLQQQQQLRVLIVDDSSASR